MKISKNWLYIIAGVFVLLWLQKRTNPAQLTLATTLSDDLTGMSVINGIKSPASNKSQSGPSAFAGSNSDSNKLFEKFGNT